MDFKMNKVKVGMIVEGTVFKVTDETVYLDIQSYADGVIHKKALALGDIDSCKDVCKVGDVLRAKINRIDTDVQQILMSRIDILKEENVKSVQDLAKSNERIKALVKGVNNGGLSLTYQGVELFMPASMIAIENVNPADFVNQTLECKVIEADQRRITVSRRVILEEELRNLKTKEFNELKVGQTITGKVTKIAAFGAFVQVGSNEGLIHISQLSHHQTAEVTDVVQEGDEVTAQIISLDKKRIGLSIKALQKTPWVIFGDEHKVGDVVTGKVTRKSGQIIYIEVARDVVGILNSKDYSWDPRENVAGNINVGDDLSLQILSMDIEKRRMALSKKHLDYNPWNDVTVKVGEEVSGTVEELQSNGALIKIQGVKAFLPISEITGERVNQVSDVLKMNDVINVVILELDKKMWKMKVSKSQLVDAKQRKEFETYLKTEEKAQSQTLGDLFGDKLKKFK
ncbi:MAG: S1 RNA-binding domain-containing protein [Firmicutes bacterium]|nr:S1 RNA-binding domain-containing protein [Bacillota bacterium]